MRWIGEVERVALRPVAPRRAAQRFVEGAALRAVVPPAAARAEFSQRENCHLQRKYASALKAAGRPGTGTSCPAPRQPLPTHPGTWLFVPGYDLPVPVLFLAAPGGVPAVGSSGLVVLVESPAVPVGRPRIPVGRPAVPEADPAMPMTRPAGFCLKSVRLLDTCVQLWDTGTSRRVVGRGSCQAQTFREITARREPRPTGSGWSGGAATEGARGWRRDAVSGEFAGAPRLATSLLYNQSPVV